MNIFKCIKQFLLSFEKGRSYSTSQTCWYVWKYSLTCNFHAFLLVSANLLIIFFRTFGLMDSNTCLTSKDNHPQIENVFIEFIGSLIFAAFSPDIVTVSEATKEALQFKQLYGEVLDSFKIVLNIDNHSAIKLIENPVFHHRSKHIDITYYFIREIVACDIISSKYVPTF